ncbi:hypothetical protein GQ457_02G027070 [Hibiscus cannabinus]
MIEQRFDDVWGLRLGLISQSKLETKWFNGEGMPYLGSVIDSFDVVMLYFTLCPDFCNSGVEYRYPINGISTQIQHWNLGIGTC